MTIALAWGVLALPAPAQGAAGTCLAFDGAQDFVHVPRSVALEPAELTIEMWARLEGLQDWNSRLLRKGDHYTYFISADQDLDQSMQLLVTQGIGQHLQAKDAQPHTAYIGTWHHFLGVYAADHAEFWVDGVRKSSVAHAYGALAHDPQIDLYIGCGLPVTLQNEYFAGQIDEVRIWNYPRTPTEIAASWNRSLTGSEAGLVAYWRFDEGTGQVAHDSSPFVHHGELGATGGVEPSDPLWELSGAPLVPGDCNPPTTYCVAAINSTNKPARIGWLGTTSLAANDLVLTVRDVPPLHPGLFFFGCYPTEIPFGEGYLCITGAQRRLRPMVAADAFGRGQLALDFANPLAPEAVIAPGTQWNFQFWYRDPQPVGHGWNLSDALNAQFCP